MQITMQILTNPYNECKNLHEKELIWVTVKQNITYIPLEKKYGWHRKCI